jgi:hypothetical protein
VAWTDTTPVGGVDAQGIPTAGVNAAYPEPTSSPKNEIGFKVYVGATLDGLGYVLLDPVTGLPTTGTVTAFPANVTSVTAPASATAANTVVVAYNAAGNSTAGTSATGFTPGANGVVVPPASTPGTTTATGAAIDATGFIVTVPSTVGLVIGASVTGGGFPPGTTISAITSATRFTTSSASTTPGVIGQSLSISLVAAAALPTPVASVAPGGFTQALNANGSATLSWTPIPGAISYSVSITETSGAVPAVVTTTLATIGVVAPATVPASNYTTGVLNSGSIYDFSVTATTLSGSTVAAGSSLTNSKTLPPVAFTGAADATPGSITLQWANNALNKNNVASLQLTWSTGATTVSKNFAAATTGVTVLGLTPAASYSFSVQAISNVAAFSSTVVGPVTVTAP